jgi:hypothetical protein
MMANPWIPSLIALLGVIAGALLKAISDRKVQKEQFDRESRRQVYETFLMAFIAFLNSVEGSDENTKAKREYVESRMKIILLGSHHLMAALNELSCFSGKDTPEAWNAFRQVALRMRADMDLRFDPQVDAFSKVLFSPPAKKIEEVKK